MNKTLQLLKEQHEDSDDVWFFVTDKYRILLFNKVAYDNSKTFHGKELSAGDSILDYGRDTQNKIDEKLITCLGKACAGQTVQQEQFITYDLVTIKAKSTYLPIYEDNKLLGISISIQFNPS